MNRDTFLKKYEGSKRPTKEVVSGWLIEKRVDDFLSSPILSGVFVGQYLEDEFLQKEIPETLRQGFAKFQGSSADEASEIKQIIKERYLKNPENLDGYLHNIQGRIAELRFHEQMEGIARFPESNNQMGYDLIVDATDGPKYVSVKLYGEANDVIAEIRRTQQHIVEGKVLDGSNSVTEIEFAVNRDIYDEVQRRTSELGLSTNIRQVDVSHDDVSQMIDGTVESVIDPLELTLSEIAGGFAITSAIHIGMNIFLWRYREKELNRAIRDATVSTALSAGGLAAGYGVRYSIVEGSKLLLAEELVLASALLGPVGVCAGLASAVATRKVLKGFLERRNIVELLDQANERTLDLLDPQRRTFLSLQGSR